jgi:hypothetical protein
VQRYLQEIIRQSIIKIPKLRSRLDQIGEDELLGRIAEWCERRPNRDHPLRQQFTRFREGRHPRKAFIFSNRPNLIGTRPGESHVALPCAMNLIEESVTWSLERVAALEAKVVEALTTLEHPIQPWEVSVSPSPPLRRWKLPYLQVMGFGSEIMDLYDAQPELLISAEKYVQLSASVVVSLTHTHRQRLSGDKKAQQAVREIITAK